MRTITMTPTEFMSFKQIATFMFDLYVQQGFVFITADSDELDKLGY